jgi:hypothetical protein
MKLNVNVYLFVAIVCVTCVYGLLLYFRKVAYSGAYNRVLRATATHSDRGFDEIFALPNQFAIVQETGSPLEVLPAVHSVEALQRVIDNNPKTIGYLRVSLASGKLMLYALTHDIPDHPVFKSARAFCPLMGVLPMSSTLMLSFVRKTTMCDREV